MTTQTWSEAHEALQVRIQADEQFHELVRSFDRKPSGAIPTRRGSRLADRICERLELDPKVYKGNVFGAALDYIKTHSGNVTPKPYDHVADVITDPDGRLADLARHIVTETTEILESYLSNGNRSQALDLQRVARDVARFMVGYTEMPDAKRAREEAV